MLLSERLPPLSTTSVNSQIQNNAFQDNLMTFQARESAILKRTSDLHGEFDDLTHLQ
jgi:hypothetical protein